jgi:hypothetical protein
MSDTQDQRLLEALLDSWDRNNAILLNLLRLLSEGGPEGGLEARAMEGSPSVSEMFTHIHHERMVSVFENAPEFAGNAPEEEWAAERDPDRIAQMLGDSAKRVRDAVKSRVETGRDKRSRKRFALFGPSRISKAVSFIRSTQRDLRSLPPLSLNFHRPE